MEKKKVQPNCHCDETKNGKRTEVITKLANKGIGLKKKMKTKSAKIYKMVKRANYMRNIFHHGTVPHPQE